jgi:hypothetical protein
MKSVYALALIASSTLAQDALTVTNRGSAFICESLKPDIDRVAFTQMVAHMQDEILQNDAPRELPGVDAELQRKSYQPIWDTLRGSIRIKMTLWSVGIHELGPEKITWQTNFVVAPTASSAVIHCASEQERQTVRNAMTDLLGSCATTKEPPTVRVQFSPVWPERGLHPERWFIAQRGQSATSEKPADDSGSTRPTLAGTDHTRELFRQRMNDPDESPELRKLYRKQVELLDALAEDQAEAARQQAELERQTHD